MAKQEFSIPALMAQVPTEADAYLLLERLRWEHGVVCPHCGSVGKHYFLTPANGTSRATRTGSRSQRRVWKCRDCRKQFSVLTGTIFHGTKIPVRTWLMVVFEMCASKNGVAAREIQRKYDLTPKSAWFMTHRIREAMKREPLAGLLGGAVQVDETWIGGEPKNRHRNDPREQPRAWHTSDKTPVVSLVHYETREVYSRVVPNVTGKNLLPAIEQVMDPKRTWLYTDGHKGYEQIAPQMAGHETVNHEAGEYARGNVSTNLVENFFGQLKRSLDGTHHHVSTEHLPRYLAEFDFRASTHFIQDSQRMRRLMGQTGGRRLTYKPLIGNEG
jgi:transposase-like protein